MAKSTTSSDPFKRSLFTPDTKVLRPWILLRVKTTENYNNYDIYSRNCADGSYMIEGVEFTVSYSHVESIKYPRIFITIESA